MNKSKIIVVVGIAVGLGAGYFIGRSTHSSTALDQSAAPEEASQQAKVWTCSMHPQVKKQGPGKCPLCFMDLIPLEIDGDEGDSSSISLKLSEAGERLADIEVQPAVRKYVDMKLSMVGKIAYNESLLSHITARVPGRIDKLFVNYTGISVRKNDHMAEYYSPDLLVAQQELLIASRSAELGDDSEVKSVKKKLELWGLTKGNIDTILKTGKVADHIILYPPNAGIVIEKPAVEGKYFKTGDRLFTVADLSEVWINLDAYENNLQLLRYGQKVTFNSVAYPGQVFEGRISFINPVLDPKTRAVKVRVDADNSKGQLKPGMFVHATVYSKISASGMAIDSSLAGKWISPMHPEIIKDEPGLCDVCGMNLLKAETLGYVSESDDTGEPPIVIPVTAPLLTGKRAVVYIQDPQEKGRYEGRVITLGQRVGDFYIVNEGIEEGELVVTKGNFKIDSALQIQAKPSMMAAEIIADTLEVFETSDEFKEQLDSVLYSYFDIQKGLSGDEYDVAVKGANIFLDRLNGVTPETFPRTSLLAWNAFRNETREFVKGIKESATITEARGYFLDLSKQIEIMVKSFGSTGKVAVIKFHCPMAFDNKGGDWLQDKEGTANPYYGASMLRCGDKVEAVNDIGQKAETVASAKELTPKLSVPDTFKTQLDMVLNSYFSIQKALSSDDHAAAQKGARRLVMMLSHIDAGGLSGDASARWIKSGSELKDSSEKVAVSAGVAIAREHFLNLSAIVETMVRVFGTSGKVGVVKFYCSMAFDNKGGSWLQDRDNILNPYYGEMMLKCGEKLEEIAK